MTQTRDTRKPARDREIALELTLQNAPQVLWSNGVMFLSMALIAWNHLPSAWVVGWLAVTQAVQTTRTLLTARYRRLAPAHRAAQWHRWRLIPLYMSALIGGLLGIALLVSFPAVSPMGRMALTVIITSNVLLSTVYFVGGAIWLMRILLFSIAAAWTLWGDEYGIAIAACYLIALPLFEKTRKAQFMILLENVRLAGELKDKNERLANANHDKVRVIATASHDLRQPVHALGLMLESWQASAPEEDHQVRIKHTRSQVNLMTDMLQGLLDISRLEGQQVPQAEPFGLHAVLQDALDSHRDLARRKGIRLHAEIEDVRQVLLTSDRGLFVRMISNLLHNAVKYTRDGSVTLRTVRHIDGLRVGVTDTGPGIDPSVHKQIFQAFTRLAPQNEDATSLGIGLTIVDKGADLLGLRITVDSRLGAGSTFTLHLPTGLLSEATGPTADEPALREIAGSLNILIVEDDEFSRHAAVAMLKGWGHDVRGAESVVDALRHLDDGFAPGLLITDFHLGPGPDGLGCVDAVRTRMGRATLSAILLTGDMNTALRTAAEGRDVRLMHKPLRPSDLRREIQEIAAKI